MRTFIAVDVPDNVKIAVDEYLASIRGDMDKNIKWVNRENMHFTIKFLGEIRKSELSAIKECVEQTARDFDPFQIELSGFGVFPSESNPRIFWIGTGIGGDTLLDIYQDMETTLENCGYDRDSKTFSPHLTIGRVKKYKKAIFPERIVDFPDTAFEARGLSIIKSTLTPEGPIYEKIFHAPFEQDKVEVKTVSVENENNIYDMVEKA